VVLNPAFTCLCFSHRVPSKSFWCCHLGQGGIEQATLQRMQKSGVWESGCITKVIHPWLAVCKMRVQIWWTTTSLKFSALMDLQKIIFESRYHSSFSFVWTHVSLTSLCLWASFCLSLFSHLYLLISCIWAVDLHRPTSRRIHLRCGN